MAVYTACMLRLYVTDFRYKRWVVSSYNGYVSR